MLKIAICLSVLVVGSVLLAAPTRISNKYDNEAEINSEFENVFNNLRNQSFRIMQSSPVYVATGTVNIDNGEIVIVSSATYGALFMRVNTRIFHVEFKLK